MALKNFYKNINFVEYTRAPNTFGDWEWRWQIGESFKGLVTTASETTQNTEALRGNLKKQYKVSCDKSVQLKKGDKIAFDIGSGLEYAEITGDALEAPEQAVTQFKLFSAQSWEIKDEQL